MLFSFYSAPLCISQPGNHPAQETHSAPQAAQLQQKRSSRKLPPAAPGTHPKLMMALGKQ